MRPRGEREGRTQVLVCGDFLGAVLMYVAVVELRREIHIPGTVGLLPKENAPLEFFPWLLLVGACAALGLFLAGIYEQTTEEIVERGGFLVGACVTGALLVALFFLAGRGIPRTVILLYIVAFWGYLKLWRMVAGRLVPLGNRPVLVLGSGEDASRAAMALKEGVIGGHFLFGWCPEVSEFQNLSAAEISMRIPEEVTDVVFVPEKPQDREILAALLESSLNGDYSLWILQGITDILFAGVTRRTLGDLPLLPVEPRGASHLARWLRRSLDVVLGGALLVFCAPVVMLAALFIMLESPGSPWIRQRRVGLRGEIFQIIKLRTMCQNAEKDGEPRLAEENDPRLTRFGRVLRRARIDELPQLALVVSGTMSLIGPRPERPEFVERFEKEVPAYRLRHLVKPGLTGLAQVMGAYATKPDVKLRYDLGYILHWNPLLDVFILIRTVSTVLRVSGT